MSENPSDKLLDAIYEAAVLPELWRDVLDRMARLSECTGGMLAAISPQNDIRYIVSDVFAPMISAFMSEGWVTRNTRAQKLASADYPPNFVSDFDLFTSQEMDRDPFYTEFLRAHGGGFGIGTIVPVPSGDVLIFNVERPYAQGALPRRMVQRLDPLRPHLARAALISARLRLERARAMVQALEAIGLPAAVLQKSGRMLAVNSGLAALSKQLVPGPNDRLVLTNSLANARFAQAFAELSSSGNPSEAMSFPIPAVDEQPTAVAHLVPIKGAAHDVFTGACAILVITPLSAPQAPSSSLLHGLFDLTPAEARVARGIVEGRTVDLLAADLCLSKDTVRTQLKSVLAKTGVSRQAELVGLLGSIKIPIRSHL